MEAELAHRLGVLRKRRGFEAPKWVRAKIKLLNCYARQTKLTGVVVGVSGGIDSAVVLSLLKRASLEPDSTIKRVLGVLLPYKSLKQGVTCQIDATKRGEEVVRSIEAELVSIDLTNPFEVLKHQVDSSVGTKGDEWAAGQLVSYFRTPTLYYLTSLLSQEGFPSIVVGTTNRDEGAYIGYFGKAADAMTDLQLISDLHKSEVYAIARYLGNIPPSVMNAIPSGDIYDGRTDEQLIGVPYDMVEFHALLSTLSSKSEFNYPFNSNASFEKLNKCHQRIEQLHRENSHKYLGGGGSISIHLDVLQRDMPGGWRPQHTIDFLNKIPLNPSNFVNYISEPISWIDAFVKQNLNEFVGFPKSSSQRTSRFIGNFGDSVALISSLFTNKECESMVQFLKGQKWQPVGINGMPFPSNTIQSIDNNVKTNAVSNQNSSDALHPHARDAATIVGNFRVSFYSTDFADALWKRLCQSNPQLRFFDEYSPTDSDNHEIWRAVGVNPLFRCVKYEKGGVLVPHYDSSFVVSPFAKSLCSLVIYLTDQCDESAGGITRFIADHQNHLPTDKRNFDDWKAPPTQYDQILASVSGKRGDALIFDHRLLHDSSVLQNDEPKLIIRTDIIFEKCGLLQSEMKESRPLGMPESLHSPSSQSICINNNVDGSNDTSTHSNSESVEANSARLFSKLMKDPFYAKVYTATSRWDEVLEGGFFDDFSHSPMQLQSDWVPQYDIVPATWNSTPLHKIEQRLECLQIPNDKYLAVLLTTGSFCPIHQGHLVMMEAAKTAVESAGGFVLGGFISPSHDTYVGSKVTSQFSITSEHRLRLCEEAVANSDWISVDRWEALEVKYAVNFTDVILHLQKRLNRQLSSLTSRPIQVVYVFGSDHARFSYTFLYEGRAVCLKRPQYEAQYETFKEHPLISQARNRIIFWEHGTIEASSTKVRSDTSNGTSNSSLICPSYKRFLSLPDPVVKHYWMRDEGMWAYSHWIRSTSNGIPQTESIFRKAWSTFISRVKSLIQQSHSASKYPDNSNNQILITVHSLEDQRITFERIKEEHPNLISLDPCLPAKHNLCLSRAFFLASSYQQKPDITNRPGYPSIETQMEGLESGECFLFDDDQATGSTLAQTTQIIHRLRPDVKVIRTITLNDVKEQHHDLVDARDLLAGSNHGGLVVKLSSKHLGRAPYCLPYVSPSDRASIPLSTQHWFSHQIWRANAEFFQSVKPAASITLKDCPYPFQQVMFRSGFTNPETTMESITNWHVEVFEKM